MFSLLCVVGNSLALDLSGSVAVNQTSDTAANAKTKAMNIARRQILFNVVSQYSDKDSLSDVLQKASNDELMNLVVSSGVANEQISANTYSANITMNLDNEAIRRWLVENNVQNWVPFANSDEKFTAFIVVPNGIADWAELKRIARSENIEIETQSMTGNQIIAKMPLKYRSNFTAQIRNSGWKFADNGGVLQIWK